MIKINSKDVKEIRMGGEWEMKFEIPAVKQGDKIYVDVHSADSLCHKEQGTGKWYKIASHDREKEIFSKKVKARELLELIAKNMANNAEPGIQNIDIARKYSNSDAVYDSNDEYDSRILSTNACSEQYLSRESLCVLGSINVEKFSTNVEEYIEELKTIGVSINRFLDNVNECELQYQTYATPHQKLAIQKLRRTGAGITNLAGWLFKQGMVYGTKKANDATEQFMRIYNYWMYHSSEINGKEKGSFGLFNKEKWKSAAFVSRIIDDSLKLNEEFGLPILRGNYARNVTNSSIAPTGTLSLMFRGFPMSYGIEPAFFMYYWKRTRMGGKYEYYFCVPRIVRVMFEKDGLKIPMESDTIQDTWDGQKGKVIAEYIEQHRSKFSFKESVEIDPMDKLELMSQVMKWVDSSISVTYMLPVESTWKDVYNFILASHEKEVKSIAAFPDKKMYGIVSSLAFKDLAEKLIEEGISIHPQNFSDEELFTLNLSREEIKQTSGNVPKRLETLDANIHVVTVKGQKFVITVGIQNCQPYEIFGGHLNGLGIKSSFKEGKIHKVKKGQYALEFDDLYIEDFSKQFTPTEQILFRMVSMSLRHGVPIQFVVDQLQKATEDITSMASAAARVLKKYIKDGERTSGKQCPSCQSTDLFYNEGCITCRCGWSKCS